MLKLPRLPPLALVPFAAAHKRTRTALNRNRNLDKPVSGSHLMLIKTTPLAGFFYSLPNTARPLSACNESPAAEFMEFSCVTGKSGMEKASAREGKA